MLAAAIPAAEGSIEEKAVVGLWGRTVMVEVEVCLDSSVVRFAKFSYGVSASQDDGYGSPHS